ncbi:tyrosine phosphatase family-domain-containing protein [Scheffersomyces xylosifermentans]|uniref:tyrosine phosphatase family-domain-containing protein n=1 Tax=Scheffersomyces xylosifermentans TaxID=1304137 RepID=UPI00315D7947
MVFLGVSSGEKSRFYIAKYSPIVHNMENIVPDPYTPPLRFNTVQKNLYRGAYPREVNLTFLKTLQLKTIISLTPNPITHESDPILYEFAQENNITLIHVECAQSGKGKKRGVPMGYSNVLNALNFMIHNEYTPVYVHCLNGGQVTSLLIACLRKLQFWSSISIFNEFINFTTNITVNDRSFVEGFKGEININTEDKADWLWVGMSKGVIGNHPRIRVTETTSTTSNSPVESSRMQIMDC